MIGSWSCILISKEVFKVSILQASTSGKGMGSQKEINLREELDLRDRTDIYRNFLHYCMSGNVVSLPMGTTGAPIPQEQPHAKIRQAS